MANVIKVLYRSSLLALVALALVSCGGGGGGSGSGGQGGQTGTLYVGSNALATPELIAVKQDGTRQRLTFDANTEMPLSSRAGLLLYNSIGAPVNQFQIWVMNTNGSNAHLVPNIPNNTTDADLSSDGSKVVYANGGINKINIDGSGNTPIRPAGGSPKWTPDGTKVAYTLWDGTNTNVYVCDADGSNPTQMTFQSGGEQISCLAVSNTHVAFVPSIAAVPGIWIVPIAGGQAVRLTTDPLIAATVSFNADGTSVYYTMANQGVFKVNLNSPLNSTPITQTWSDQTVVWGE